MRISACFFWDLSIKRGGVRGPFCELFGMFFGLFWPHWNFGINLKGPIEKSIRSGIQIETIKSRVQCLGFFWLYRFWDLASFWTRFWPFLEPAEAPFRGRRQAPKRGGPADRGCRRVCRKVGFGKSSIMGWGSD